MVVLKPGEYAKMLAEVRKHYEKTGEIQACLFNLVIYANQEARANYLYDIAHAILEKFPCRILFIRGIENDAQRFTVSATTEGVVKGNRTVKFDEVIIDVGAERIDEVPFALIPQLVPDLPIYLLWGQDPTTDDVILPHLEKDATKIIFDSECTDHLGHFATQMLRLELSRIQIMDLNWATICGWRSILSRVYDTSELIDQLSSAKTVHIYYNQKTTRYVRSHETKAIYLQCWLAARLRWECQGTVKEGNRRTTTYRAGKNEFQVILSSIEEPTLPAGAITGFDVLGDKWEHHLRRRAKESKVTISMTQSDSCQVPYPLTLPDLKQRSVFMREIFYRSVDDHYKAMLAQIAATNWSECDETDG